MATITQIAAAQTPKPPCNTCGHRPRAGSMETTPSPVSRSSSYTAVSVPPTVSEVDRASVFTQPLTRSMARPATPMPAPAEDAPQPPSRWQRALHSLKSGLTFGHKGG